MTNSLSQFLVAPIPWLESQLMSFSALMSSILLVLFYCRIVSLLSLVCHFAVVLFQLSIRTILALFIVWSGLVCFERNEKWNLWGSFLIHVFTSSRNTPWHHHSRWCAWCIYICGICQDCLFLEVHFGLSRLQSGEHLTSHVKNKEKRSHLQGCSFFRKSVKQKSRRINSEVNACTCVCVTSALMPKN